MLACFLVALLLLKWGGMLLATCVLILGIMCRCFKFSSSRPCSFCIKIDLKDDSGSVRQTYYTTCYIFISNCYCVNCSTVQFLQSYFVPTWHMSFLQLMLMLQRFSKLVRMCLIRIIIFFTYTTGKNLLNVVWMELIHLIVLQKLKFNYHFRHSFNDTLPSLCC